MSYPTTKILTILLASGSMAFATTVKGKITSQAGRALANAKVSIDAKGFSATTASDGTYSIVTSTTAVSPNSFSVLRTFSLQDGILALVVDRAVPVDVQFFDLAGTRLRVDKIGNGSEGSHRWDLSKVALGSTTLLVRTRVGGVEATYRYVRMGSGAGSLASLGGPGQSAGILARTLAVTDSLKVTVAGFRTRSIPLSSLDTTVNLSLDTALALGYPMKNLPVPSSGCGKPLTLKTGTFKITSAGLTRDYTLSIPANYNPAKPSRLIFGMHWMGGNMGAVNNENFYQMRPLDSEKNIVFVAPQGYTDASPWRGGDNKDHIFFEDLLKHVTSNMCIDSSRVFSMGFSFGAMFTNSISRNHQKQLRAVVVFAAADYNIYVPTPLDHPIGFMGTVGLSDELCPPSTGRACKNLKVTHNKCTVPGTVPETTKGSGTHVIYDYQGCGHYPVKWVTFDGGHDAYPKDRGQSNTWMTAEVWKFINQF